jgi:hypothetical protein
MDPIVSLVTNIYYDFKKHKGKDTFAIYATWILNLSKLLLENPKFDKQISKKTRQIFELANNWLEGEISFDNFAASCYSLREISPVDEALHRILYCLLEETDGLDPESGYFFALSEKDIMEILCEDQEQRKVLRMDNFFKLIEIAETFS